MIDKCSMGLLALASIFGAGDVSAAEWSRDVVVSQITINASDRPANTAHENQIFVDVSAGVWGQCNPMIVSVGDSDKLYSSLMMAYSAGMSITMTVDDTAVVPGTDRCRLTQINVRQ